MDKKAHILQTATHLFAHQGFHGTGTREIAKEADVNIAMIAYYFGSKDGILETIITGFYDTTITLAKSRIHSTDSLKTRFQKMAHILTDAIRENEAAFRVTIIEFPMRHEKFSELKQTIVSGLLPLLFGPHFKGFWRIYPYCNEQNFG